MQGSVRPKKVTTSFAQSGGPVRLPDQNWPHHALLIAFTFIWGANFVLAEVALREMSPIAFSVSRFLMGAAALMTLLYAQIHWYRRTDGLSAKSVFPKPQRRHWPLLIGISLIGATFAPWLGIEGLNLTHAGRAALWLALAPALSAGIGAALRTERLSLQGKVGLALAGAGTLGLVADGLVVTTRYWIGDLLLLVALLMTVLELHLIKPLAGIYGATAIVALRTVIGGLLYLLIASPTMIEQPWPTLGGWTWFAILFGGMIGVGTGQWVKVRALKPLGPTRVVLYGNVVPIAALLIAWLALGNIPTALEMLSAVLILFGALLTQATSLIVVPTDGS